MPVKTNSCFPNVRLCTPDSLGAINPGIGFILLLDDAWCYPEMWHDEIEELLRGCLCGKVVALAPATPVAPSGPLALPAARPASFRH